METLFQNLGLNLREQKVLQYIIRLSKPVRSFDLAKQLDLPRQTVYSILKRFAERGLVVQTDNNGVRNFYSNTKELIKFIDLERTKLFQAKQMLHGDQSFLVKQDPNIGLPRVHFYRGGVGMRKLFESILSVYEKGKSKRFRGYGINHFSHSKTLGDYLKYLINKRGSYGVKTQLFIAQGPDGFNITDESKALGRSVKRLNIEPQMAGIYLVADCAYFFSYKDNIGIMIENQAIVGMLKDIFDDHWERVD